MKGDAGWSPAWVLLFVLCMIVACAGRARTVTILASGQSNAVGCAEGSAPAATNDVVMWQDRSWIPAADPVSGFDRSVGCEGHIGPWTTLGHTLSARKGPGTVVRLVGTGRGSTLLVEWDEDRRQGKELTMLATVSQPDLFVFYQGEGDAAEGTPARDYANRLVALIGRVKMRVHRPLTVVIVGLASPSARRATRDDRGLPDDPAGTTTSRRPDRGEVRERRRATARVGVSPGGGRSERAREAARGTTRSAAMRIFECGRVVPRTGIEPVTPAFSVLCSTD